MNQGKIPTTPTSSSVIAGIQVQEMLKLLHKDRKLPVLAGKGFVFNGLTHDSYVVEYQEKPDCMSHDIYEDIIEKDWSVDTTTLSDIVREAKYDIGNDAVVDLGRDIVTEAKCVCGSERKIFAPLHKLQAADITCEQCGCQMTYNSIHLLQGNEGFLNKTAADVGIPKLDIISGREGMTVKYYEFSQDAPKIFET
jgi:adenylyltransferase/sulfurtransferase